MDANMTVIRLTSMGLPPYAARGITQTLRPINAAASLRRNINGALQDVADPLFRKFESTISGDDVEPPAFEMVWPGRLLTVECSAMLRRAATTDDTTEDTTEGQFERPSVPGSITIAGGFISYRPVLQMRVTGWDMTEDEWRRGVPWSLGLEEV